MNPDNVGGSIAPLETASQTNQPIPNLKEMLNYADTLIKSNLLPSHIKNANQGVLLMLQGRELGLQPIQAINNIYVVNGKTSISSNMMASLISRSDKYRFKLLEWTDEVCKMEFFEIVNGNRESMGIVDFTIAEAKKAGLTNNPTWTKYTKDMLKARCLSRGARLFCADVIQGMYETDEIKDDIDGGFENLKVNATLDEVKESIFAGIKSATSVSELNKVSKRIKKSIENGLLKDIDVETLQGAYEDRLKELTPAPDVKEAEVISPIEEGKSDEK